MLQKMSEMGFRKGGIKNNGLGKSIDLSNHIFNTQKLILQNNDDLSEIDHHEFTSMTSTDLTQLIKNWKNLF